MAGNVSSQPTVSGLSYADRLRVYQAALNEQPCPLDAPQAQEYYGKVKAWVAECSARGEIPEIPHEWPEL
jgi:hypothetical protein